MTSVPLRGDPADGLTPVCQARTAVNAAGRQERMRVGLGLSAAIAASGALLLLGACGSHQQISAKTVKSPPRAAGQAVSPSPEVISPQTSALAARSQRDVEALLAANAAASKRQSPAMALLPDEAESAFADPKPSKPVAIVWNEAAGAAAKSKAAIAPAPEATKATRPDAPASLASESTEQADPLPNESPSAALAPPRLDSLMIELSRELYGSAAYSETPMRELAAIAAICLIEPSRQLDPQAIPAISERQREQLARLQSFFTDLGKALQASDDDEVDQAIASSAATLREAFDRTPLLSLPTMDLCTRVGGFGDYAPFERRIFLAGAEQRVIVYLEVEDFTSEINASNEHVTELAQQLTIYSDRDGIPVWKEDWQTAVDVSRNRRQDFFTVQVVTLPKALSVGKYQLKIRVRDEKSRAEAEGSIEFEMVADPRMAVR